MAFSLPMRRVLKGIAFVVVSVMAIVGAFVLVCHFLFRSYGTVSPSSRATTNARVLRSAVQQWQAVKSSSACPSVQELKAEKHLDEQFSEVDSWGTPFRLDCRDDDVSVSSAGDDRAWNTADDITVPRAPRTDVK